jgi:prepilin peptidase CpaA
VSGVIVQFVSLAIRITVLGVFLWLAVVDIRTRSLPTRAVLLAAALFFVDAAVIRMPITAVAAHLALAVGVFLVCAALFFARMIAGGDAKLAATIFLWVGLRLSIETLTLICALGTVVGFVSLATRRMNADQRSGFMRWLAMFSGSRGVPYGVALALGGGTFIVAPPILSLVLTR